MNAYRIMVVDDFNINQLIKLYLEKEGFLVRLFRMVSGTSFAEIRRI